MPGPSTTGFLGLDISEFERNWERVISNIGKAAVGGAIVQFTHTLVTAGREANTLTKALDDLDISTHADKFGEADIKARGFRDSILDITAALSRIPVIGTVVDIAMAPLKDAVETLRLARRHLALESTDAGNSSAMLEKFQEFERLRSDARKQLSELESPKAIKEAAIGGTEEDRLKQIKTLQSVIEGVDESRVNLAEKLSAATLREARARNEILAGSQEEARIAAVNVTMRERLAALNNALVNKDTGEVREEDKAFLENQRARIITDSKIQIEGIHAAARATRDIESGETKIAATKMFGLRGELAASNIRLEMAKEVYEIEKNMTAERRKAAGVSLVSASVDALMKKQAMEDSEKAARLQVIQEKANVLGLTQIAARAKLMSDFMPKLAQSAREFGINSPQFAAAQAGFKNALIAQKVAERDETGGQKVRAALLAHQNLTKSRQMDARDAELQRRADRGVALSSRDAARLFTLRNIGRNGPALQRDQQQREMVVKAVVDIANIMKGGK